MGRVKRSVVKRSSDNVPRKDAVVLKQGRDKNILAREYRQAAFAYIKELREKKLTYDEIAEKLTKEGWTGPNDSRLNQPVLSRFMINNGYRVFEPHKKANADVPAPAPNLTNIERQLLQLFQTNFDSDTRLELAKTLIDKHMRAKEKEK